MRPPFSLVIEQHSGNVIRRAALFGKLEQVLKALLRRIAPADRLVHLLVRGGDNQPVRAEQQPLVRAERHIVYVALDMLLGAERTGDEVAVGVCARWLGR